MRWEPYWGLAVTRPLHHTEPAFFPQTRGDQLLLSVPFLLRETTQPQTKAMLSMAGPEGLCQSQLWAERRCPTIPPSWIWCRGSSEGVNQVGAGVFLKPHLCGLYFLSCPPHGRAKPGGQMSPVNTSPAAGGLWGMTPSRASQAQGRG